jgi:hypothetical protein
MELEGEQEPLGRAVFAPLMADDYPLEPPEALDFESSEQIYDQFRFMLDVDPLELAELMEFESSENLYEKVMRRIEADPEPWSREDVLPEKFRAFYSPPIDAPDFSTPLPEFHVPSEKA